MTRIAVTGAGLAGWGLALWLTVRYHDTRRVPVAGRGAGPRLDRHLRAGGRRPHRPVAPRWPRPSRSSPAGMAALLPVLPTALAPPVPLLVAAAIGAGARVSPTPGGGGRTTLDRTAAVAVRVVAGAGTVWLLALAAEVLSG